jgi:tetratricopeptide (TPR) repeat protein
MGRPNMRRPGRSRPNRPARPPRQQPDDERRNQVLIDRYLAVLTADPRESFALSRLLDLYRERDGNVDGLITEVRRRIEADATDYAPHMILGHVYKAQGRLEDARGEYERAAELRADAPAPLIALGRIAVGDGDHARARELYERALEHTSEQTAKQELLRQLGTAALAMEDWDGAREYYDRLARGARGSVFLLTEYARALVEQGQHERAVAEYERVIGRLRGDNRVLSPILREMGQAQLEAGDADAAIETLSRALRLSGRSAGVRVEIYDTLVEAYRRGDRLPELAEELSRRGGSFEVQELLGRIHDELGHEAEALAAYRRALRSNPRHIDTRVRVIQLLSRSGRIEDVIDEYESLIRTAPREPRFVVELAQLLMQVGRREEALRRAAHTSRRYPREPAVHQALAELYSRWGEDDLAAHEVAHLARIEPNDPAHLVALGAQQLEAGDRRAAVATWRRILTTTSDRGEAHAALGAVYADHDMLEEAAREYREAVEIAPEELAYVRGLANVLERLRQNDEAITQWERVLELAGDDRAAKREARQRIVGLWSRGRMLTQRIAELTRRFRGDPPDVEAGRFLAEAHRRAGPDHADDAERVLSRVISLEPGDVESLLALERVRTSRGDLAGAIEVLRLLVEADARRAPSYLSRMAEHALSLYRDEEAVQYAAQAVERTPDDANAHRRLGDLYRARQDNDRAIASYRRAIELNDRLFPTYFDLAEIHLARGDLNEADRLFRRVFSASPDDDLVSRAARASIQIHLGEGTLLELERDLLPLALGHPQRPVYRKLVVELYDGLAAPWIEALGRGGESAAEAEEQLRRLGSRALKPLLEALSDDDPSQQRVAVTILGHLANENAAAPLLAAAEGDGDMGLRVRALAAAGAVAPPELAPRFAAIAEGPERRLRAVAGWGLAKMGGRAAIVAMRDLLSRGDPSVRAFAALGLGRARDRESGSTLASLLRSDRSVYVQAATAWALGRLGDDRHTQQLVLVLRAHTGVVAIAAAAALGNIGDPDAREALAEALFDADPTQRRAAAQALRRLSRGERSEAPAFPVLSPGRTAAAYVGALVRSTDGEASGPFDVAEHRDALREAAIEALRGPVERVAAALEVLLQGSGPGVGLGPLTEGMDAWSEANRAAAEEELGALSLALLPELLTVARHPAAQVRASAVELLARIDHPDARRVVAAALSDDETPVLRAALSALRAGNTGAVPEVASILRTHRDWAVRTLAADTLGRVGGEEGRSALERALREDDYAFVRQSAVRALGALGGASSRAALSRAASEDPEPRVREAARRALE